MLATPSVQSLVSIFEFSIACRMIISSCALVGDSKRGGGRRARFWPSSTGSSHEGFPGSPFRRRRGLVSSLQLLVGLLPPPPISSRPRFIAPGAAAGPGGSVAASVGVMAENKNATPPPVQKGWACRKLLWSFRHTGVAARCLGMSVGFGMVWLDGAREKTGTLVFHEI